MQIQIWSDVVCPWCYLGKRRFEHALAEFDHRAEVHVVHRAFQLDPSLPKDETFDQIDRLTKKYGLPAAQISAQHAELTRMGAVEGLEYNLAGGREGNTFDAHQLVRLGLERGLQQEVLDRFFRAHFTEQRSLFDADSLVDLAVEAGLDADEARAVLTEQTYAKSVEDDLQQALAYGATGVPFFVIDERYGVSGAQPRQTFAGALERAWADQSSGNTD
jgi:predicted DsbA family dithiol-disulfide isomerase